MFFDEIVHKSLDENLNLLNFHNWIGKPLFKMILRDSPKNSLEEEEDN